MSSNKRIVVTGASGFLGSHLISRIKDNAEYTVYAISSHPDELKSSIGGSDIIFLNREDIFSESGILQNAVIVNCAYPRNSTGTVIADGLKYTQRVFEASVENRAYAIINMSSQSVYPQQRTEAATEETALSLETPYAVGKYAVELMLESICKGSKTLYTSLRLASLIGPGFDQRIVNRFVRQAIDTGKLTVKNNRRQFGFFDVEDAVSGIYAVLNSDLSKMRPVYNLGREGTYSLVEMAEAVGRVLNEKENKLIEIEVSDGDEISSSAIDCRLFKNDFGFSSEISLESSLIRIYDGVRK